MSNPNGGGVSQTVKDASRRRGPVKKNPSPTVLSENPSSPPRPSRSPISEPQTPQPSSSKGKRKADEVEGNTPPDVRKQKATFAADPRPPRASGSTPASAHAPSSYTRKRARLSTAASTSAAGLATVMASVAESSELRPPSRSNSHHQQTSGTTGTWSSSRSRSGGNNTTPVRTQSRTSHRSQNYSIRPASRGQAASSVRSTRAPSRRGSLSQASIPISALVSPHAPSISQHRSTAFHMRDPRKPPKTSPTPWTLTFPQAGPEERGVFAGCFHSMIESGQGVNTRLMRFVKTKINKGEKQEHADESDRESGIHGSLGWTEGGGSPPHAWLFFLGFIIFPVWWIAGLFVGIPRTRRIEGGSDGEKAVILDDPQVEHDAKSWRFRCRVMAAVSLFTYIPFIVLVAVFVPRN